MLNREFTKREKLLLVACFILGLCIVYYQFVYKGIIQHYTDFSTSETEAKIQEERDRLLEINNMLAVIKENEGKKVGDVAVYNNLAGEIAMVGAIMENKGEQVSVSWSTPVLNGMTVRRDASISFSTRSYENLKAILREFNESIYRCLIQDLSVTDNSPTTRTVNRMVDGVMKAVTEEQPRHGIKNSIKMSVSFRVTFFETIEGSTSTEGLIVENASTDGGSGALAERGHAYENS